MAKRTPRNQARSQYHSYWGEFAYSSTAPVPSTFQGLALSTGGMELPNAPSWTGGDATDLERGDVAFVFDALGTDGNLYAPWVCLDAGTVGGLDAVWNRVSPLSTTARIPVAASTLAGVGTNAVAYGAVYLAAGQQVFGTSRALVGAVSGGIATVRVRRQSTGVLVPGLAWSTAASLTDVVLGSPVSVGSSDWYVFEVVSDTPSAFALVQGVELNLRG